MALAFNPKDLTKFTNMVAHRSKVEKPIASLNASIAKQEAELATLENALVLVNKDATSLTRRAGRWNKRSRDPRPRCT